MKSQVRCWLDQQSSEGLTRAGGTASKMARSYGWTFGASSGQEASSSPHVGLIHIGFNQGHLGILMIWLQASPRTSNPRENANKIYVCYDFISKITHHHFATLYLLQANHKFWLPFKEREIGYHLFKEVTSRKNCRHIFKLPNDLSSLTSLDLGSH